MDTYKNDILTILEKRYNDCLVPKTSDNGSRDYKSPIDWGPDSLNNIFNACGIEDAYEVIYENIWEETLNH